MIMFYVFCLMFVLVDCISIFIAWFNCYFLLSFSSVKVAADSMTIWSYRCLLTKHIKTFILSLKLLWSLVKYIKNFCLSLSLSLSLSAFLSCLLPESFTNTQTLLNSLSETNLVHQLWIFGHSFPHVNNLTNPFAKHGASYNSSTITFFLSPLMSFQRFSFYTQYSIWFFPLSNSSYIFWGAYSFLFRFICLLSRLRCNKHMTLGTIKRKNYCLELVEFLTYRTLNRNTEL